MKDEFERKARDYVGELTWVKQARARRMPRPKRDAALTCRAYPTARR